MSNSPSDASTTAPTATRPKGGLGRLSTGDVLSVADLSTGDIDAVFSTADTLADDRWSFGGALDRRSIVMLFEKPSLRTRVTFEVGPARLGAHVMYFDHSKQRIGEREPVLDYAKNLERWADAIVARTYSHRTLVELAEHASVPVVNALSDLEHPCQALADFFTLRRRLGRVAGLRLAYVGDGNNVCHSLLLLGAALGAHVTAIGPDRCAPDARVLERAQRLAAASGGGACATTDLDAIDGADAVYADTWVSMGAHDSESQRAALEAYQVDAAMMARATSDAVFMHCLPAHRGEEVTPEVIDGPASIVYDQAENRMHVQNALLAHLLLGT
ncbi:MAG: ornithine carbamoyltransferase [Planctomycetota bacterium]